MKEKARTSGGQARTGQSIFRILLVVAMFMAVFTTALILGREVITPSAPPSPDVYRGAVQLAPNKKGLCDKFELANQTGTMRWKGSERCSEVTTAVPGQASGSVERLNAISEHFRSR
jgi:hypothetical protein